MIGKVDLIAANRSIRRSPQRAADPEPEDASLNSITRMQYGALLAASGFVILRTVLKRISRKLKKEVRVQVLPMRALMLPINVQILPMGAMMLPINVQILPTRILMLPGIPLPARVLIP